jgi:hypothetical protein
MNKHKNWLHGMLVCGLAVSNASCVGLGLLGMPLGPQTAEGLYVEGAVAPTVNAAGCLFPNPATVFRLFGEMEVGSGNTAVNEYTAVLQATNTRKSNECAKTATLQPNYQSSYGCVDTNGISIIAANVRYEYPTLNGLSTSRFTNQQMPADGIFFQNQTSAGGYVSSNNTSEITVKVMNRALAQQLADDPDFIARLSSDQSVPIIARIRLEGRTDGGARAMSNEFVYRIEARAPGTLDNCAERATVCPTTLIHNPFCFKGQDDILCSCP